jgi:hypothetical protein
MILSILFIHMAKRLSNLETEMQLAIRIPPLYFPILKLKLLSSSWITRSSCQRRGFSFSEVTCRFILLSFSFGTFAMQSLTCHPPRPDEHLRNPPKIVWIWYKNALITCHLAQATTGAAGAAWYFSFSDWHNQQGMLGGFLGGDLPKGI